MRDAANEQTEIILKKLEAEIANEYARAYKDIVNKLKAYLKQFNAEDVLEQERLAAGEITKAQYDAWRTRKILLTKQWTDERDALAVEMHHINEKAMRIAREQMPEIFALNANYAGYQIEADYGVDTAFAIYNRQAAERLLAKQRNLLPAPGKRKALELWENPDVKWNEKQVQSAVLQGILQGESMDKIANRLIRVSEMNYHAAVRNARTMTTCAQNAGREAAYKQMDENNTKLTIVWMSTLDNRTRHSHREMHGEVKEGEYYSNGLRFPGDPSGDPAEVYNCRCQERAFIKGMEDIPTYSPKMGNQTFKEWLGEKETEGLLYHKNEDATSFRPISDRMFNALTAGVEKKGGEVHRNDDLARMLLKNPGDRSAIVGTVLAFGEEVSKTDVYEELRHLWQNTTGFLSEIKDAEELEYRKEIDAKKYLISNAKQFKIPREETAATKAELEYYEGKLRQRLEELANANR